MKKLLIANRGEIAVRIIRAAKELGIKTVAVYSEADKESLHVKMADEAVCIGPAAAIDSYLKIPNIIAAAEITGADAIHPGYGFLAEDYRFSKICRIHNLIYVGPNHECIKQMGDKATARQKAIENDVPVTNGTGIITNIEDAKKEIAERIGYPVMIKATAGGGGKGMRIARNDQELEKNIVAAQNEAEAAFNNPDVFVEKFVENPKHIEIQIVGDKHGNIIHLGERNCSIQRRNQKLIEESPSFKLPEKVRRAMGEAAVRLAKSIGYDSAGTLEFLVDSNNKFYFMEMNTRIQVEHTVTEAVTGLDIIKLQISLAEGDRLNISQEDIIPYGHAIECRINAEDTENHFIPCPGKITKYVVPGGIGIRVDSHSYQGYEISPYYDSMIGKIITFGMDREEAIARMKRALNEFIIEGVETTIPFHLKVLENKNYLKGNVTTSFIEKEFGL